MTQSNKIQTWEQSFFTNCFNKIESVIFIQGVPLFCLQFCITKLADTSNRNTTTKQFNTQHYN